MAFDQTTRNRLQKFVLEARDLLRKELTRQMQHDFGMDPETGKISEIEKLTHLDDARQETARMLRDTFDHYMAAQPFGGEKGTLDRIAREQSFTVLNRLCALRMAEARGFLIESITNGYQSKGFQLYARLAGHGLGELGEAYQSYLFSLFDEFAVDLPVLFDRYSAMGRLFPKDTALRELLDLINAPDIAHLWAEDETIGWIYQYFNSKEERRQMRDASQAPRNSRELAVRNQFFTPRYVVEFLTDNTLGRIWYEMTQGNTALIEDCQYLVRRPDEVFLSVEQGPVLDWFQGNNQESEPRVQNIAHSVNGYLRAGGLHEGGQEWLEKQLETIQNNQAEPFTTQAILDVLFVLHQMDQRSEGTIEKYQKAIDGLMAILRQRVEESQKEDLSQQDLLNQPVFIPLRAMKDPRDIKILDPACGSGHFLLYAFDLLETIYKEYWDLEDQAECAREKPSKGLSPLKEVYETKDELIADLPRLVIEYNLHGIDIDPRAVQIAGLSLWLRAQRGWQEQGIKPNDRPAIQKSNIVCAEPMPGEKDMLREFADSLKPKVLGQLVEIIFEKMALAGEAGPLLKIEEEIADAVDKAREEFNKELLRRKEEAGYLPGMAPKDRERSLFDFSDLPDKTRFWEMAEEKILGALQDYAEQVENGDNSRRRLFANDAAKGFAFIDLCRKRYDVVLMNPPFGESPLRINKYLKKRYGFGRPDAYLCFFSRSESLQAVKGFLGAITSRTFQNLEFFMPIREKMTQGTYPLVMMADLSGGVLDGATVETCLTVLRYSKLKLTNQAAIFFNATSAQNKNQVIDRSVSDIKKQLLNDNVVIRKLSWFAFLPGSVISYYIHDKALEAFLKYRFLCTESAWVNYKPIIKSSEKVLQGLIPGDLFRFTRLRYEIGIYSRKNKLSPWPPICRGGDFKKFYSCEESVFNWINEGKEVKAFAEQRYGGASRTIKNTNYFFKGGFTYPRISSVGFNLRIMPEDHIFSDAGLAIFLGEKSHAFELLGYLNSRMADYFAHIIHPGRKFEIAHISSIPVPETIVGHAKLNQLSRECVELMRMLDCIEETSPFYINPAFSIVKKE